MTGAGAVMIVAVVLIVLALVYYLVFTIVALKQITEGLDDTIASVVEIIEKSAPVNEVVVDINTNLDVAVGALETVESEHLRPLEPAVKAINAQFDIILGALPGIAAKAAVVADRRPQ